MTQVQICQRRKTREPIEIFYITAEVIIAEIKVLQVGKVSNLNWKFSTKITPRKIEISQIG
ncbi:hypothetical protein C1H46_016744 [Malus baccata]|uniref:Uncharacterized protein n=1 Tax=Malus baccata TaxID=106549 RepID=A0A540MFV7_MALBA|nr:hypothetical protein C1H46_016744 [Malus baccata]